MSRTSERSERRAGSQETFRAWRDNTVAPRILRRVGRVAKDVLPAMQQLGDRDYAGATTKQMAVH